MNNIFRIYKRDIKNIITNYVALIIILALIILPALYAWFNIAAGWDPYSNTKNLSVAIVNLDEGSEFRNVKINVGKDIVSKLKNDQNIGWKFVSRDQAENGVKTGKYYASITITKDFSKNLLSIVRDNVPRKSQLIYSVNEKVNAIAPKITKSGATALEEQITKNFIETCSDTILSYLNQFGFELESIKPQLQNIADIITDIDKSMPQIGNYIDTAYTSLLILKQYLANIQKNIPVISDSLNKTISIAKTGNEFMEKSKSSIQMISSGVRSDLNGIKGSMDSAATILNGIKTSISQDQSKTRESLVLISDSYSSVVKKVDDNIQMLNSINQYANSSIIANFINGLSNLKDKMTSQQSFVNSVISYIDAGKQVSIENINSAIDRANEISNLIDSMDDTFNQSVSPEINNSMKNISGISNNSIEMLQDTQKNLPLISSLIGNVNTGVDVASNTLKDMQDKFPEIQNNIHSDAEKIGKLSGDKKLNEVINILKRDAKAESDFLANPVEMKQERIYPIPNYGSAMSPFYTTLALWVGAFILLSILSVEVRKFDDNFEFSSREQFFGRYLTFTTISIMQAVVL